MFHLSLKTAWRSARARPLTAAAVVVILALGIGAATAIYSVVDAVVLRQLPVREPERLVWMWNARVERDRAPFSFLDLRDYREGNTVLEGLAAFSNWTANLTGTGDPERLEGVRVEPEFFSVLGVSAVAGRVFREDDGRAQVVMLTDGLWRRRFGGDSAVVGRALSLNGTGYTIVGILPPGFAFPFRDAELAVPLPLDADPRRGDRGAGFLRVVARLKPGVSIDRAKADLDTIGKLLRQMYPEADAKKSGVNLFPLNREMVGDARALLLTLLSAVILVLLVACANIASLLLSALFSRRRELSVRVALGATRARIIGEVLLEVIWLVAAGTGVGLLLAHALIRILVWWGGPALPQLGDIYFTPAVYGAALGASAVAALVCGLAPALFVWRTPAVGLSEASRGASPGRWQRRVTHLFVCAQVAATLGLLVAAAVTVRSYVRLVRVDPGFAPGSVLSVQLSLPPTRYGSTSTIAVFADALRDRLLAANRVRKVSAVSLLPLSGLLSAIDYRVSGRPEPPKDEIPQAHYRIVMPAYFRVMGIPLTEGREFSDDDRETTRRVAVISHALADRHWRSRPATGDHLVVGNETIEIIGVCADVKQFGLDGAPTADLYVPLRQAPANQAPFLAARMYWVVRAEGDPMAIADAVRQEVRRADADVASSSLRPLEQILTASVGTRQFNAGLLEILGLSGLVLSILGVYGVTAFAVRLRAREIAIRLACGATPSQVVRRILASELPMIAAGLLAGGAVAVIVAREVTVAVIVAATLGAVAVLACYLPARRAAAADPRSALHDA